MIACADINPPLWLKDGNLWVEVDTTVGEVEIHFDGYLYASQPCPTDETYAPIICRSGRSLRLGRRAHRSHSRPMAPPGGDDSGEPEPASWRADAITYAPSDAGGGIRDEENEQALSVAKELYGRAWVVTGRLAKTKKAALSFEPRAANEHAPRRAQTIQPTPLTLRQRRSSGNPTATHAQEEASHGHFSRVARDAA